MGGWRAERAGGVPPLVYIYIFIMATDTVTWSGRKNIRRTP